MTFAENLSRKNLQYIALTGFVIGFGLVSWSMFANVTLWGVVRILVDFWRLFSAVREEVVGVLVKPSIGLNRLCSCSMLCDKSCQIMDDTFINDKCYIHTKKKVPFIEIMPQFFIVGA